MAGLRAGASRVWRQVLGEDTTDAQRQRAKLKKSGLVDLEWFTALTGTSFTSVDAAIDFYLDQPQPRPALSPWVQTAHEPSELGKGGDPLLNFMAKSGRFPHFPFLDKRQLAVAEGVKRPWLAAIRDIGSGDLMPVDDDWAGPIPTYGQWRTAMIAAAQNIAAQRISDEAEQRPDPWPEIRERHQVDWQTLADEQANRVHDRVSVVIPTFNDWKMTVAAVRAVLRASTEFDVEVVVIDNGSEPNCSLVLAGALSFDPRIRLIRQSINLNFALGSNVGFAESSGQTVVFLNNDTHVRSGWLAALVDGLADPNVRGVQPLLLYPDETIQSAGTLLPDCGGLPSHFLVGFPADDAYALGTIDCSVVTAAALAMRASEVIALRGFDTAYINGWEDVDLCLRALEQWGGHFEVTSSSVVVHHESKTPGRGKHIAANRALFTQRWADRMPPADAVAHWRDSGFDVVRWDPGASVSPGAGRAPTPVLLRPKSMVLDGRAAGLPSLRWAIKIAAWPGPRGEHWGDVHFAADLARSLRRLGQEVVVDPRTSTQRTSSGLDDVVLVLRGLIEVDPQPGRVNMMWVISHPDMVTPAELARFDICFAAGAPWAQQMTAEGDIPVRTLLQATDPERFHPGVAEPDTGQAVLFVGGSRRHMRPIVRDSIAARLDLAVYGGGWRGEFELPAGVLRAEYLPNEVVPAAYRSAGIVLSDHWADMAAAGFLSNRLFDAVGAGARVISDDVSGIEDVFGDAVAVYQTVEDLERLCSPEGRSTLPTEEQLQVAAQTVRQEHSFDARAWELLNAAVLARG
ncbi:MAG: glycosyltransferase [Candidatus Nanopelagicales bacterium]